MELEDLGWNNDLQYELGSLGLEGVSPGRVFRVDAGHYGILTTNGEIHAKVSGRMRKESVSGSDLPGVGDWVIIKPMEMGNIIFKVMKRTSRISRKVPGKEMREQLVAANIDLIFIVMGMDLDYNPRRLERYLTMVAGSGAAPVVILNKMDLTDQNDARVNEVNGICDDIPVHAISALEGDGLGTIKGYLVKGKTIALVGSSGAGKSTLINSLIGKEVQRTEAVRENDNKGRHVTTSRELLLIPGGGMIIDNPGIREIQLWGDESSLNIAFKDIDDLSSECRFKDCQHLAEPGCAVKDALEDGTLARKRYDNYQKMKRELQHTASRVEKSSEAIEKEKWKPIMKGFRQYYRYKKGN